MKADDFLPEPAHRPFVQKLGAILWPSFFAAAVAAAIFFTFVDPIGLARISFPGHEISRGLGYSVGFFLLWAATLSACGMTCFLLRPVIHAEDGYPLE